MVTSAAPMMAQSLSGTVPKFALPSNANPSSGWTKPLAGSRSAARAEPSADHGLDVASRKMRVARYLMLCRTGPRRRFRTTVITHRSRPGLLRQTFLGSRTAGVQTSLAGLGDRIPTGPRGHDHDEQSETRAPRFSASRLGQVNLTASMRPIAEAVVAACLRSWAYRRSPQAKPQYFATTGPSQWNL